MADDTDDDSKYSSYPANYDAIMAAKARTNTAKDANTKKFTKGPTKTTVLTPTPTPKLIYRVERAVDEATK